MTSASIGARSVNAEIGRRVHTLLWEQRRRQTWLAIRLGLTSSVLSKKLRGDSAWSAEQVAVAAYALGVPVATLYGDYAVSGPSDRGPGDTLDRSIYFHGNEYSHTRPGRPPRNTHPGHRKRRDVA